MAPEGNHSHDPLAIHCFLAGSIAGPMRQFHFLSEEGVVAAHVLKCSTTNAKGVQGGASIHRKNRSV